MSGLELVDAISVHDVYVTGALFEDAGDGQMRVIRYVKHNGTIVPMFSYVTPAAAMIRDAQAAMEFAFKILKEQAGGSH